MMRCNSRGQSCVSPNTALPRMLLSQRIAIFLQSSFPVGARKSIDRQRSLGVNFTGAKRTFGSVALALVSANDPRCEKQKWSPSTGDAEKCENQRQATTGRLAAG